ncbi:hypothetical protein KKB41_02655 [Patescibacteria group bacterium]|nr:hypothetical protein [Patescibacteria group bacterium]
MSALTLTTAVQFDIIDDVHENVKNILNTLCADNGLKKDEIKIEKCERYTNELNEKCTYLVVSYQKKIPAIP